MDITRGHGTRSRRSADGDGGRRGRGADTYGALLLLILLSLLVLALVPADGIAGRLLLVAVEVWVVVQALRASDVGARTRRVVLAIVAVAVAAASGVAISGVGNGELVVQAVGALLLVIAVAAIVRRLGTHTVITRHTVLGLVCIYLLVGVFFASVYGMLASSSDADLFAQGFDGDRLDHVYFSFTTLTTVGFGDLSLVGDLPRMIAVTEALLGQIYLVTVVALAVGHIGVERRRDDEDIGSR